MTIKETTKIYNMSFRGSNTDLNNIVKIMKLKNFKNKSEAIRYAINYCSSIL
jgi:Arc/MetJ-type ribon-helix-helix transcriptional regulator